MWLTFEFFWRLLVNIELVWIRDRWVPLNDGRSFIFAFFRLLVWALFFITVMMILGIFRDAILVHILCQQCVVSFCSWIYSWHFTGRLWRQKDFCFILGWLLELFDLTLAERRTILLIQVQWIAKVYGIFGMGRWFWFTNQRPVLQCLGHYLNIAYDIGIVGLMQRSEQSIAWRTHMLQLLWS